VRVEAGGATADTDTVLQRLRQQSGFGLIELLMAMVILQIALLALVAVFGSSAVAMGRAARIGTASAIADRAMEQYRAYIYGSIGLNTGGSTDSTYLNDASCPGHGGSPPCGNISVSGCTANPKNPIGIGTNPPDPCAMKQTITGPDNKTYRIDTYIVVYTAPTPVGGQAPRSGKLVTVVVRDPSAAGNNRVLARESSTFDCSTGGGTTFNSGC
jgi:type II secretory pathway pseudopilin PulG